MNEVEKMYKNAGIEKCNRLLKPCPFGNECDGCEHYWYPDFDTEKQLELIKWLAKSVIKIDNTNGEYEFSIFDAVSDFNSFEEIVSDFSSFEESLADLINRMWQSLTEEEKQQIRRILE